MQAIHLEVDSNSGPSGLGFGSPRFFAAIRFIRCCTRWTARSTDKLSFLVRRARMHTGPVALCNIPSHSRAALNTRTTISSRVSRPVDCCAVLAG